MSIDVIQQNNNITVKEIASELTVNTEVNSVNVSEQAGNTIQLTESNNLVEIYDKGIGLVTSVNGQQGAVVLDTDDIAEGDTNLYDKTVSITAGTNIDSVTGTYPDFTINAANQDAVTLDTRSNILASTPDNGTLAYATDTKQYYIYNDSWQEFSSIQNTRTNSPNMGARDNENLAGYGEDYITDKNIANCTIGGGSSNADRTIRVVYLDSIGRDVLQIRLDNEWKTILSGVNIITDDTESPADIEFTDFNGWNLSLVSGNSDALDPNGVPVVNNLSRDIGAFQSFCLIDGGSF